MRRPHIACHFAAACEVAPGGEHFDHAIGFIFPDKSIWTIRAFLARRRSIENDFDGMVKEMDCLIVIRQKI